jgi:hypothetical protein
MKMAEFTYSKTVENAGWGDDKVTVDDFVAGDELTVTITLHEYRNLIKAQGGYERKLKEKEDRNTDLVVENSRLKATIETMRESLGDSLGGGE